MCGRFNLHLTSAELQQFFDLLRDEELEPRYNIAPSQSIITVGSDNSGAREVVMRRWGLVPIWAKDAAIGSQMINARSETAAEKPAFRAALRRRRCLIPASGFYEWQVIGSGKKQAWHITLRSGEPLVFAGLWESWQHADGSLLQTCAILTTAANRWMSEIHDRMPVLLTREQFGVWLDREIQDAEAVGPLLQACPEDWLTRTAVSSYVNNVRHQGPGCLKPVTVQRGLF